MIIQLYTFAPGSYVVADEWNANFRAIYNANLAHVEAIQDMNNKLAFKNGDLSSVYAAVRSQPNCFEISGTTVTVEPECEYYKDLPDGLDLNIVIPNSGLNASVRVLIRTSNLRTLLPAIVTYNGQEVKISFGEYEYMYFPAGMYYIMIYETNGFAQAKLIWTGV